MNLFYAKVFPKRQGVLSAASVNCGYTRHSSRRLTLLGSMAHYSTKGIRRRLRPKKASG
jgi:hypothetical protein